VPEKVNVSIRVLIPKKDMIGTKDVVVTRDAMDDEPHSEGARGRKGRKGGGNGKNAVKRDLLDFLALLGAGAALEDFKAARDAQGGDEKASSSNGGRSRHVDSTIAHLLK
jgi:hypothetical protein